MCHNDRNDDEQVPILLVGTRKGDIFEINMKVNYEKKKGEMLQMEKS